MKNFKYATHPKIQNLRLPAIAVLFNAGKAGILETSNLPDNSLLVGYLDDQPVITCQTEIPEWVESKDMRLWQPELEPPMLKAVNRARQLINWQENFQYCGRCGTKTELHASEPAFYCAKCGASFYPRLDPAVIVAVLKNDEILLAHNARFSNNIYGLIAGFIEGGETMEDAVRREVMEEVSIKVRNIRYFRSQNWPFPNAFMLGCIAEYESGDVTPDGVEIVDAGFFRRDNLPELPLPGSVARGIVNAWINGELKGNI